MTHYDPRDYGKEDPPPSDDLIHFIGMVIFIVLCIALLTQCSDEAKAQIPPFLLNLPDGTQQQACSAAYEPTAKQFDFGPCVTVFVDGFEGSEQ